MGAARGSREGEQGGRRGERRAIIHQADRQARTPRTEAVRAGAGAVPASWRPGGGLYVQRGSTVLGRPTKAHWPKIN